MLGIKPETAGSGSKNDNHCAMLPPIVLIFLQKIVLREYLLLKVHPDIFCLEVLAITLSVKYLDIARYLLADSYETQPSNRSQNCLAKDSTGVASTENISLTLLYTIVE